MISKTYSFGILGLDAYRVEIEIDVASGLPAVNLVGLADAAIKESKDRVRSAIKNSGFEWPASRITVNLAPSDIKKEGSWFDLPIAIGILAATEQIKNPGLGAYSFLGELALDGQLRPVQGVLTVSMALAKLADKNLVLPQQNGKEAAVIPQICAWPFKSLNEVVQFLADPDLYTPLKPDPAQLAGQNYGYGLDFSEIKGQYFAKRALEVAVAGGHNIIMVGPPGSGKSMLAKRIPTIMPQLSLEETLEITRIHSVAASPLAKNGLAWVRPFRSPHHSISDTALIGGGSVPKPGEISLAHYGVLFLDELAEFNRKALEALRQPLEDSLICVSRVKRTLVFPASFILVGALNPCPCGNYFNPQKTCRCPAAKIRQYLGKISGPLLDRIDLHIEVPPVKYHELEDNLPAETSGLIRQRVEEARIIQKQRFSQQGTSAKIFCNAQMSGKMVKEFCVLEKDARQLLRLAISDLALSARAYEKILKVSRTISDLAKSPLIRAEHVAEAVQYRSLDKQLIV